MRFSRRSLRNAFLLAFVALLAHLPALAGLWPGAMPSTGDTLGAFVPWHEFARRSLWQRGEIPLWNPHLYCGMPFLANGQSGLLYPPTYLHFLLPENIALWLFAWSHSCLYMLGGYFLGRVLGLKRRSSFLIALLLGLGNATPAHLFGGHLTFLPARAYWPWEATFLLRLLRGGNSRDAVAWAACLSLSLAAGAPQLWLFGLLFNVALLGAWGLRQLWRGPHRLALPRRSLFLGLLLMVLWCAPILLPLQELKPWSAHGNTLSFAEVTDFSATSKSLFRLLLSDFFGGNSFFMWSLPSNPGEDAASLGAAGFLLALASPFFAGRRHIVLPLYGFCGSMLVLALGRHTALYRLLYDHFSLFQLLRVPARWLELWALGAAILAGLTFDGILRRPQRARWFFPIWVGAAASCLILLGAVYFNLTPFQGGAQIVATALNLGPEKLAALALYLQGKALLSCFYAALTLALLAWFWKRGFANLGFTNHHPDNRFVVLILILLAVEPLANFWFSTRTTPPSGVSRMRVPSSFQSYFRVGERWIVLAPFGEVNAPMLAGLDAVNGYEPFGSRPFFQLAQAAQGPTNFSADFKPRQMEPLWRVAGASRLLWKPRVAGEQPFLFPGRTIARAQQWRLNTLSDGLRPWPQSYLTRQVVRAEGPAAWSALQKLARQPWQEVPGAVVPTAFPLLGDPSGNPSLDGAKAVTLANSSPDARFWRLNSAAASLLVENESLAPGWKAFVDGRPARVYQVNGIFRGIYIPAGSRSASLVLDSQTLRFSLFLALGGLSLAALLLSAAPRKTQ